MTKTINLTVSEEEDERIEKLKNYWTMHNKPDVIRRLIREAVFKETDE